MVKLRGMGWVGKDEKDQTEFFLLDFGVYYKAANRRNHFLGKEAEEALEQPPLNLCHVYIHTEKSLGLSPEVPSVPHRKIGDNFADTEGVTSARCTWQRVS